MTPPLVEQARRLAAPAGFTRSCTEEVGRLLQLLTAQQRAGVVGEMGTGYGVGTAWMASALQPGVSLVTVEADETRAVAAAELFRPVPAVRVLAGDWRLLSAYGPFALLFVDAAEPKREHPAELLAALAPGGLIVLDDFTPAALQPEERRGLPDPLRDFWLGDPHLRSLEIQVAPDMSVILAGRVPD